jgi:hypothetical protein
MNINPSQPEPLQCLACGHRLLPRRAEVLQRRCGQCGSTGTVAESDLALASLALKPWAYLISGSVPPLPLPHELVAFPAALAAYARVMGQATQEDARRRAVALMLQRAGFSETQVANLVQRWEGPGD